MDIETSAATLARIDERTKHMVESLETFKVNIKEHLDYQDQKIEALPSWRTFSVGIGGLCLTGIGWLVMYYTRR